MDEVDVSAGVGLGAQIMLHNETLGKELTVRLVSAAEAAVRGKDGVARVSEDSPVGRELLGRNEGDSFTVKLENGKEMKYTVKSFGA